MKIDNVERTLKQLSELEKDVLGAYKQLSQLEKEVLEAYKKLALENDSVPSINELLENVDFSNIVKFLLNENLVTFRDDSDTSLSNQKEVW